MSNEERELPPDVELLVREGRGSRLELALGRELDEVPLALERGRCDAMAKHLKTLKDEGGSLSVREVYAVFEADERGLLEVLYAAGSGPAFVNGRPQTGAPMTAYLRGTELAYVAEGW